jgi:hypothetical protein
LFRLLRHAQRSSANACHSSFDASFVGKGKTDGFAHRAPLSARSGASPADGERQGVIEKFFNREATSHAQMPPLRPALRQARASR